MNEIILKKYFLRFIKENDISNNLRNYFGRNVDSIPKDFNSHIYFDAYISWSNSEEGYYFWKIIQIKYIIGLIFIFKNYGIRYVSLVSKTREYLDPDRYFTCDDTISESQKKEIENLRKVFYEKFGY